MQTSGMRHRGAGPFMAVLCVALVGCPEGGVMVGDVYVGPPGSTATHINVEVRHGGVGQVWKLRSAAAFAGSEARPEVLPEGESSGPLPDPARYTIVSSRDSGTVEVNVEGLAQDGTVLGRGQGSVELRRGAGVTLSITLQTACDADQACDDGDWCNGTERCVERACAPGPVACPPSPHACVRVTCRGEAQQCDVVPEDARCTNEGTYCDVQRGCMAGSADAPALSGEPLLQPLVARVGTRVTLSLDVSEPLLQPPDVRLDAGGGRLAAWVMDMAASRPGDLHYVYAYVVDGSELQGARPITVDLEDATGTRSTGLGAGTVRLDFLAPSVVSASSPARKEVRPGDVVETTVVFSEALASAPRARLVDGNTPAGTVECTTTADSPERHVIRCAVDTATPEGRHRLLVDATDVAGNAAEGVDLFDVTVDATPPSVLSARVLPAEATYGRAVTVEVTLDEVASSPGVLLGVLGSRRVEFSALPSAGTLLSFLHVVEPGEDGTWDLQLAGVEDAAGNAFSAVSVGALRVDGLPPQLSDVEVTPSPANASHTVVVRFRADEPLGGMPVVLVGNTRAAYAGETGGIHVFELALAGSGLAGTLAVTADVQDVLGNRAVRALGNLEVDAVPPGVLDVVFSPALARLGVTALLSVSITERLQGPPVLRWDTDTGDPGFVFGARSGTSYTFELPVTAMVAPGIYRLDAVEMVDQAGNPARVVLQDLPGIAVDFAVDSSPPVLDVQWPASRRFSAQEGHNLVETYVSSSESLVTGRLDVNLEGRSVPCEVDPGDERVARCRYRVTGFEVEGLAILSVTASDSAGNTSSTSLAVQLDFQPPGVVAESTSVVLVPPPGSPVRDVTRITHGTVARVTLAINELGPEPVLMAAMEAPGDVDLQPVGAVWTFNTLVRAGTLFVFEQELPPDWVDEGPLQAWMVLEDDVGNRGMGGLEFLPPGLEVDLQPPPALDVDAPGRLVFRREPWGTITSQAQSRYELRAAEGAVPPGTVVLVHDGVTEPRAEVGRFTAWDTAAITAPLQPTNRPSVAVTPVDEAGNVGPTTLVRDVETVMSMGGKVAGSTLVNPHVFTTRTTFDERGAPRISDPYGNREWTTEVAGTDDVHATASTRDSIRRIPAMQLPPGTMTAHVAYDSGRGRVVHFGGFAGGASSGETMEWDGRQWLPMTPTDPEGDGNPPARTGGCMAYDSGRRRTVLFGGVTTTFSNDTWEWDGQSWRRVLTSNAPTWGRGGAVAYDPRRGEVVLYGGYFNADTWTFNGVNWTRKPRLDPEGDGNPPQVTNFNVGVPGMTYDATLGQVVFLGGEGGDGNMWSWNGSSWKRWPAPGTPGVDHPGQREGFRMDHDPEQGRVLLFGGLAAGVLMDDLWEGRFNGAGWSWTRLQPLPADVGPEGLPTARDRHSAAWDPVRGNFLVFGGRKCSTSITCGRNDTWTWDDTRWTLQNPEAYGAFPRPSARARAAATYDRSRGRVVLFGGSSGPFNTTQFDDTWEFDGAAWRLIPPVSPRPRHTSLHALVYEPTLAEVLFFGGRGGTDSFFYSESVTWTWNGTRWLRRDAVDDEADGEPLPSTEGTAMALDQSRAEVLLYGTGTSFNTMDGRLWAWRQDSWTRLSEPDPTNTTAPAARLQAALAHDAARQVTVMWGGMTGGSTFAPTEPWEWDGTSWNRRTPQDPEGDGNPEARALPHLVYDEQRRVTLMFGGTAQGTTDSGPWAWDGNSWRRITFTDAEEDGSPVTWREITVARDPARGATMLIGGRVPGTGGNTMAADDVWAWETRAGARTGAVFTASLSAAGMPGGSTLLDAVVEASGTSTSWFQGATDRGIRVGTWEQGTWAWHAEVPGEGADVTVTATITDTARLEAWKAAGRMDVAITPRGGAGPGATPASVEVDAAQVTVRYRVPPG